MTESDQERELFRRTLQEHREAPHGESSDAQLRLHVALHVVVEQQLATGKPEAVTRTLARLVSQGLTRHQAIHAIASVTARELREAVEEQGGYDERRYVNGLEELSAESWQ